MILEEKLDELRPGLLVTDEFGEVIFIKMFRENKSNRLLFGCIDDQKINFFSPTFFEIKTERFVHVSREQILLCEMEWRFSQDIRL